VSIKFLILINYACVNFAMKIIITPYFGLPFVHTHTQHTHAHNRFDKSKLEGTQINSW